MPPPHTLNYFSKIKIQLDKPERASESANVTASENIKLIYHHMLCNHTTTKIFCCARFGSNAAIRNNIPKINIPKERATAIHKFSTKLATLVYRNFVLDQSHLAAASKIIATPQKFISQKEIPSLYSRHKVDLNWQGGILAAISQRTCAR